MNKILCSTLMLAVTSSTCVGQEVIDYRKQLGYYVVDSADQDEDEKTAETVIAGQAVVNDIAPPTEPAAHAAWAYLADVSSNRRKCSACHAGAVDGAVGGAHNFVWMDYADVAHNDFTFRATLSKPDSVTRSFLKLKDDTGIVVDSVCPSNQQLAQVLKSNDIILSVNDKPVAKVQEVTNVLNTTKPLTITVLRAGQKEQLVRPGKAPEIAAKQKRYLVGIMIGELSPVVVSQLQLDESVSVFVRDFSDDSAGKAAGIKINDIVLKVDGKVCDSPKTLQQQVQESKGKKLNFEVLRDGTTIQIEVAPHLIEASYIAVTEVQDEPAAKNVFEVEGAHVADVSPMIDNRQPLQAQLIPHQGITVYPPSNLSSATGNRAIHDQLQKIEKQLELVTKALEALAHKK
ncbi:MAG: PDZ domain-containing protein [Fuerstiella sp.]